MASISSKTLTDREEIELVRADLLRDPRNRSLQKRLRLLKRRYQRATPRTRPSVRTHRQITWNLEWRFARVAWKRGHYDNLVVVISLTGFRFANAIKRGRAQMPPDGVYYRAHICRFNRRVSEIDMPVLLSKKTKVDIQVRLTTLRELRRIRRFNLENGLEVGPLPRGILRTENGRLSDDTIDSLRYHVGGDVWTRRGRE